MKQFWVVWNAYKGVPTVKHETEQSARDEAERLSILHPGHRFHVLKHIDTCVNNNVLWDSGWENIPF